MGRDNGGEGGYVDIKDTYQEPSSRLGNQATQERGTRLVGLIDGFEHSNGLLRECVARLENLRDALCGEVNVIEGPESDEPPISRPPTKLQRLTDERSRYAELLCVLQEVTSHLEENL